MSRVDEILDELVKDFKLAKAVEIGMMKIARPWQKHNESEYSKRTNLRWKDDGIARFPLSGSHVARVVKEPAKEPKQEDYICSSCEHLNREDYNEELAHYLEEVEIRKTRPWEWACVFAGRYEHGFVATQEEGMAAADAVLRQWGWRLA